MRLREEDSVAGALCGAIRAGDHPTLRRLLRDRPGLAGADLVGAGGRVRTPLHVATDWPGYQPGAPATVRLLIEAGADADARSAPGGDTALHGAATTDDVDVAEALVDGGADLEAVGSSTGGSPLEDAVGYGCWHVARLLVARGARVDQLWVAAAVGLAPRVEELLGAGPDRATVTEAFWQACHGGQRRVAARLLDAGADPLAVPPYAHHLAVEVAGRQETRREGLVAWLRELGDGRR